jgi:hypothetical protein
MRLLAAAPNWVMVESHALSRVRCRANPPRASGQPTRSYNLVIAVSPLDKIEVSEASDRHLLPTFCPQRHMNEDGTFCLGLNAGQVLAEQGRADSWWLKLHVFLTCQETAFETRTWPPTIEISHGQAGETEIQAENLAEQLDMLEEYQTAVRENRGPIADAVRRIKKSTGRLINGRAACVCNRRYKTGEPKLRRQCWKSNDLCLPILEARRRREEENYWSSLKENQACCGTMDDCPLK